MQQMTSIVLQYTDYVVLFLLTRLWRALAEHALKAKNFDTAEKSFVRCAEYQVQASLSPDAWTLLLLTLLQQQAVCHLLMHAELLCSILGVCDTA